MGRPLRKANPSNVVAYLRVSTDEQTQSGAGIEAQRAAVQSAAQHRGWTVIDWFVDEGVSGTRTADNRPQLAAALAAVRTDKASTLVVAKLDRLSRNFRDAVNLIADAEDQGWNAYACDGTIDMTSPAARFQTRVMIGVAELERDMIAQRTKDALAAKKASGVRLGRPPVLPSAVVGRIVAERDAGRSLWDVANGLSADGIPTARGNAQWKAASVRAVYNSQAAAQFRCDAARATYPRADKVAPDAS